MPVAEISPNLRIQARERIISSSLLVGRDLEPTEKSFLEEVIFSGKDADTKLRSGVRDGVIGKDVFTAILQSLSMGGHINDKSQLKTYTVDTFKTDMSGAASSIQSSLVKLKSLKEVAGTSSPTAKSIFEAIQKLPAGFRNIPEIKAFETKYNTNKSATTAPDYSREIADIKGIDITNAANSLELHSNKKVSEYFEISPDGAKVKFRDETADALHGELKLGIFINKVEDFTEEGLEARNSFNSFYASLIELGHDSPSDNLRRLHAGGDLEGFETSPTNKPIIDVKKEAFETAFKEKAEIFQTKSGELPTNLFDSDGKIDLKAIKKFVEGLKEHGEDSKKVTVDKQKEVLAELLKAHGNSEFGDLTGSNIKEKVDELIKNQESSGKPENKGFWFGGGVVNWALTAIATVLSVIVFKMTDENKKKLKEAAQKQATEEAQVAQVAEALNSKIDGIGNQAQTQTQALQKQIQELKKSLQAKPARVTSGKTHGTAKNSKAHPGQRQGRTHRQDNNSRMNAPGDEVNDVSTGDGSTGDMPPIDDANQNGALPDGDMNPNGNEFPETPMDQPVDQPQEPINGQEEIQPEDDQQPPMNNPDDRPESIQGNYDQDGRSPEANSTIEGQPNSTTGPMEGQNSIKPFPKQVKVETESGQPVQVSKRTGMVLNIDMADDNRMHKPSRHKNDD